MVSLIRDFQKIPNQQSLLNFGVMMKITFTVLLCCVTVFLNAQSQNNRDLLWEISGNGLKQKSYLFGTLHSNDRRLFQFADSFYIALDAAQTIAIEADISSLYKKIDIRKEKPTTFYDKNGNPYTPSLEASKTAYGDENGMPQFMDAFIQVYADNSGKKLVGIETLKEQMSLFSDVPTRERKLVDLTLGNFTMEKLVELYLKGDIYAIDRFMKSNLSVQKDLYDKLIVQRNQRMTRALDSLMNQKKVVFCAVGAGHLGGSEGIIQQLRAKGYKLRAINWQVSEGKDVPSKTKVKSFNSYLSFDETSGYSAKFPGKPLLNREMDGSIVLNYAELGQGNYYSVEIHPYTDESTPEQLAAIYIASPNNSPYRKVVMDDGTFYFIGISDAYPEGLSWVQIQFGEEYFIVSKVYGGNKFLHSDRPKRFFEGIWFEKY